MSLLIDSHEVEERHTEHGILNAVTGAVLECDSQSQAEFDALLYPYSEVIKREVYVTKWVNAGLNPS